MSDIAERSSESLSPQEVPGHEIHVPRWDVKACRELYKSGYRMIDFEIPEEDQGKTGVGDRLDNITLIFAKEKPWDHQYLLRIPAEDGLMLRELVPADTDMVSDFFERNAEHFKHIGELGMAHFADPEKIKIGIVASDSLQFAVEDSDAALAGLLTVSPGPDNSAELGIMVDQDRTLQGIAGNAIAAAIKFSFEQLTVGRVFGVVRAGNEEAEGNTPAARLFEKAGFILAGVDAERREATYELLKNPPEESIVSSADQA